MSEFDWKLKYRTPDGDEIEESHKSICYGVLADLVGHMSWKDSIPDGSVPEEIISQHEIKVPNDRAFIYLNTLRQSPLVKRICKNIHWDMVRQKLELRFDTDHPSDELVNVLIIHRYIMEKPEIINGFYQLVERSNWRTKKEKFFVLGAALACPFVRGGFDVSRAESHMVLSYRSGPSAFARFSRCLYTGQTGSLRESFKGRCYYRPGIRFLFDQGLDEGNGTRVKDFFYPVKNVEPETFIKRVNSWLSQFRKGRIE